ncbi:MAG: hypothetical protein KAS32_23025 [Candidatus Peribacteraceae bacterium]|nr:hypothetical protein [Candidatus Peribacteraceae bacterium]
MKNQGRSLEVIDCSSEEQLADAIADGTSANEIYHLGDYYYYGEPTRLIIAKLIADKLSTVHYFDSTEIDKETLIGAISLSQRRAYDSWIGKSDIIEVGISRQMELKTVLNAGI